MQIQWQIQRHKVYWGKAKYKVRYKVYCAHVARLVQGSSHASCGEPQPRPCPAWCKWRARCRGQKRVRARAAAPCSFVRLVLGWYLCSLDVWTVCLWVASCVCALALRPACVPSRYKRVPLDTMRYNVSEPSLDTMDTYLACRGARR